MAVARVAVDMDTNGTHTQSSTWIRRAAAHVGAAALCCAAFAMAPRDASADDSPPPPPVAAQPPPLLPMVPAAPPAPVFPAYRSPGMMIGGISLTALGATALVTGLFFMHDAGNCSEGCWAIALGVPLITLSTVLAGVGIPLWVVGAQPRKAAAVPSWTSPQVSLGAGTASLRFTF